MAHDRIITNLFSLLQDEEEYTLFIRSLTDDVLKNDIIMNAFDPLGNSFLMYACQMDNYCMVKKLLQSPVINVNASSDEEHTALMDACRRGHIEIVKLLLAHKDIDYNASDIFGTTALMSTCHSYIQGSGNNLIVVKELLKIFDINYNDVDYIEKESALMIACKRGHTDIFNELMKYRGIVYDNCNINKETVLILACKSGNIDIVRTILKIKWIKNWFVNSVDNNNKTALMHACSYGYVDIVIELMCFRGTNIHYRHYHNRKSALEYAETGDNFDDTGDDCHREIVKLIKKRTVNDYLSWKTLYPLSRDIIELIINNYTTGVASK